MKGKGDNMTKRSVYTIIITEEVDGFYVSIPDFETATQGESIADAIMMARDAIGLMGIDMQDEGKELPTPYSKKHDKQGYALAGIDTAAKGSAAVDDGEGHLFIRACLQVSVDCFHA